MINDHRPLNQQFSPEEAHKKHDDIWHELPKDSMKIPHPDGLNLGEYSDHIYEVAKLKGIVGDGGWSGMTMALIRMNIKEWAEKGELWMPPEDWIPRPRGVLTRSNIVALNASPHNLCAHS